MINGSTDIGSMLIRDSEKVQQVNLGQDGRFEVLFVENEPGDALYIGMFWDWLRFYDDDEMIGYADGSYEAWLDTSDRIPTICLKSIEVRESEEA